MVRRMKPAPYSCLEAPQREQIFSSSDCSVMKSRLRPNCLHMKEVSQSGGSPGVACTLDQKRKFERGSLARAGCGSGRHSRPLPRPQVYSCSVATQAAAPEDPGVLLTMQVCTPLLLAVVAVRARAATVAVVHKAGGRHPDGLLQDNRIRLVHTALCSSHVKPGREPCSNPAATLPDSPQLLQAAGVKSTFSHRYQYHDTEHG